MDSHGTERDHRRSLRAALTLATAVGLAVLSLTLVQEATRSRVAASEQARRTAAFDELLGGLHYDNELMSDWIDVHDPELLGTEDTVQVYRARQGGRPLAAIFEIVAPDGYSGAIRIALAVTPDGHLLGVRVVEHHETPGLGDAIEERRSGWIRQFDGRSLVDPPTEGWAVRKDGGAFDQLTGATVTPRAVIGAVRDALRFVQREGPALYAPTVAARQVP